MKILNHKAYPYLIAALFMFPLLKESLGTFIFIIVTIFTIAERIANKSLRLEPLMLLFTIPFWIVAINWLVFGADINQVNPIQQALFFLLFPLLFAMMPTHIFTRERVDRFLHILKYCCFVMAWAYVFAFLYFYDFKDFFVFKHSISRFRDFVYYEIPFFKMHPTYFTSIALVCSAFAFDNVLRGKKYIELVFVASFAMFTYLVLAKANMILMSLLLSGMLLFRTGIKKNLRIATVFGLIFFFLLMFFTFPGIQNRFQEIISSYDKPPMGAAYNSTNIRVAIVNCSLQLAGDHFVTGVGFANIGRSLLDCYRENYLSSFYGESGYLTHNYYLYILISSGVVGLSAFLFYVSLVVRTAIRTRRFVLNVLLATVFIMCLTEDYLYRHYGIFFFSLVFFTFYKMNLAESHAEK